MKPDDIQDTATVSSEELKDDSSQTKEINWAQKLKFNVPRTACIGLAFFAISLFWQAYYYVVPLILGQHIKSDTVINLILMVDNILAIFMLPLIGTLSDKTNTRFGKRMPYIVVFTIGAAVSFALTALADARASLPMILIFLMLSVVFMSGFRSPAVALMPDLTPKPLRSKGNAIINIMGVIGGIIGTLVLVPMFVVTAKDGFDENGNQLIKYGGTDALFFILVAVTMLVAVGVLFVLVKEKKIKEQVEQEMKDAGYDEEAEEAKQKEKVKNINISKSKKVSLLLILISIFLWFMGYTAITTAASRYGYKVWNSEQVPFALTIAQVVAFIGAVPAGMLASKIGRKWTIMIGIVVLTIGFGSLAFFNSFNAGMFVFFGLIGLGWIVINVNSYPMVVELAKGPDVGKYTGYYYFFSMSAQMITKLLSGALMDLIGYEILFPYGAIFVAAAFVTMFFVKFGDSADKKMQLKNQKV